LFTAVAAFGRRESIQVTRQDRPAVLQTIQVSANLFSVLGVATPEIPWRIATDQTMELPIVVIDDGETAAGTSLLSGDGRRWRVAGVLPLTFVFPQPSGERVTALTPLPDEYIRHRDGGMTSTLHLIARLAPGVSSETANAALTPPPQVLRGLPQRPVVESLALVMTRRARALALGGLLAGILIFAACAANIANLLATRGAYRLREFAVRQALGATRMALARLVLVELACLTAAGVGLGLILTAFTLRLVEALMPMDYATLGAPVITVRVAVFAALTGLVVMVTGLLPAWAAWRVKVTGLLAQTAPTGGRGQSLLRFGLTASQAAVAMILLVGGALLVRSHLSLVNQDTGFAPDAFVVSVLYPSSQEARLASDVNDTIDRLRFVPNLRDPAAVRGALGDDVTLYGLISVNRREMRRTASKEVTPGYARATGTRLVAGRFFTEEDGGRARVVNEAFARACCADRPAIGSVFDEGDDSPTIVGILADTFDHALDRAPSPVMFAPLARGNVSIDGVIIHYVFRTDVTDRSFMPVVARQLLQVNPSGVITDASTLEERLLGTVKDRFFATTVVGLFAVTALCVSAAGLVGVVGFSVARRTREIAIRVAIGARSSSIRWLVMREAVVAGAAGALGGLALVLALSGNLTGLLYGISPEDSWSVASALLAMVAVIILAAIVPATRALRIQPSLVLKSD
jgi:predicted permease